MQAPLFILAGLGLTFYVLYKRTAEIPMPQKPGKIFMQFPRDGISQFKEQMPISHPTAVPAPFFLSPDYITPNEQDLKLNQSYNFKQN